MRRIIFVVGYPGIGKSHLINDWIRREGALVMSERSNMSEGSWLFKSLAKMDSVAIVKTWNYVQDIAELYFEALTSPVDYMALMKLKRLSVLSRYFIDLKFDILYEAKQKKIDRVIREIGLSLLHFGRTLLIRTQLFYMRNNNYAEPYWIQIRKALNAAIHHIQVAIAFIEDWDDDPDPYDTRKLLDLLRSLYGDFENSLECEMNDSGFSFVDSLEQVEEIFKVYRLLWRSLRLGKCNLSKVQRFQDVSVFEEIVKSVFNMYRKFVKMKNSRYGRCSEEIENLSMITLFPQELEHGRAVKVYPIVKLLDCHWDAVSPDLSKDRVDMHLDVDGLIWPKNDVIRYCVRKGVCFVSKSAKLLYDDLKNKLRILLDETSSRKRLPNSDGEILMSIVLGNIYHLEQAVDSLREAGLRLHEIREICMLQRELSEPVSTHVVLEGDRITSVKRRHKRAFLDRPSELEEIVLKALMDVHIRHEYDALRNYFYKGHSGNRRVNFYRSGHNRSKLRIDFYDMRKFHLEAMANLVREIYDGQGLVKLYRNKDFSFAVHDDLLRIRQLVYALWRTGLDLIGRKKILENKLVGLGRSKSWVLSIDDQILGVEKLLKRLAGKKVFGSDGASICRLMKSSISWSSNLFEISTIQKECLTGFFGNNMEACNYRKNVGQILPYQGQNRLDHRLAKLVNVNNKLFESIGNASYPERDSNLMERQWKGIGSLQSGRLLINTCGTNRSTLNPYYHERDWELCCETPAVQSHV